MLADSPCLLAHSLLYSPVNWLAHRLPHWLPWWLSLMDCRIGSSTGSRKWLAPWQGHGCRSWPPARSCRRTHIGTARSRRHTHAGVCMSAHSCRHTRVGMARACRHTRVGTLSSALVQSLMSADSEFRGEALVSALAFNASQATCATTRSHPKRNLCRWHEPASCRRRVARVLLFASVYYTSVTLRAMLPSYKAIPP